MTQRLARPLSWLLALLAVAALVSACGDDAKTGVEFGEGELPATVPADFPMPDQAKIQSTLIDHDRDRTEFNFTVGASVEAVARYFDENLANRGYVVERSSGDATRWTIEFAKDGMTGTIRIESAGLNLSQGNISLQEG